jgi:hypothetical protein
MVGLGPSLVSGYWFGNEGSQHSPVWWLTGIKAGGLNFSNCMNWDEYLIMNEASACCNWRRVATKTSFSWHSIYTEAVERGHTSTSEFYSMDLKYSYYCLKYSSFVLWVRFLYVVSNAFFIFAPSEGPVYCEQYWGCISFLVGVEASGTWM